MPRPKDLVRAGALLSALVTVAICVMHSVGDSSQFVKWMVAVSGFCWLAICHRFWEAAS